jgi:hypothetical protein
MDSSGIIHLLLKLFKGVLDNLASIRSDIHFFKLILDSFGIWELIKLRSHIIFIEIISSFSLLNLLMDFIFHLIDSIMIIRDFEGLTIDLKDL